MEEIRYELDAKGDIYLALDNVSEDLPESLSSIHRSMLEGFSEAAEPLAQENEVIEHNGNETTADTTDSTDIRKQHRLLILVSSKHLMLSCPQFERRFQDGFQEGNELKSTGKKLTIPVQEWGALPFLILMLIIHHQTRSVPRTVSLERLAEIAQLVDYYKCYEAVEVFSDMWINRLAVESRSASAENAEKWLFISCVFKQASIFEQTSKYLQLTNETNIETQFPLPYSVRDAIDNSRRRAIEGIVNSLHELCSKLRDGPLECCYQCDSMLLGALVKEMIRMDIFSPRPEPDYIGFSFIRLAQDCRRMRSPEWYIDRGDYSPHGCNLLSKIATLLNSLEKSLVGLNISSYI